MSTSHPRSASTRALRSLARRGLNQVEPLERRLRERARRAETRDAAVRLAGMTEQLRARYLPGRARTGSVDPGGLPPVEEVAAVEAAVLADTRMTPFLRAVTFDGSIEPAAVKLVRTLMAAGERRKARAFAQALQRYDGLRPAGDVGAALLLAGEQMTSTAWTLYSRNDVAFCLRHAPAEYFHAGFAADPAAALGTLEAVLRGEYPANFPAPVWLEIARRCLARGALDACARVLDRADEAARRLPDRARAERLATDARRLRTWRDQAERAAGPVPLAAREISFAVLSYDTPQRMRAPRNLAATMQTLAALGHVARRTGVRFTGDQALVEVAETVRSRVPEERRVDGDSATVRLCSVDRDAASLSPVPEPTWVIVHGDFMQSLFGVRFDLPLNARLRPIFVSFHIGNSEILSDEALAYLREYGPVGCRDRATMLLLLAAGVPAFFSGDITATVDAIVRPADRPARRATLRLGEVEPTDAEDPGDAVTLVREGEGPLDLAVDAPRVLDLFDAMAGQYRRVVTADPHAWLAARAVGAETRFQPPNPSALGLDGLIGIDDDAFAAMQRGLTDKLAVVLSAILSGAAEDEVYQAWREACSADVAVAARERAEPGPIGAMQFDIAAACAAVRREAVTVERREPGPPGSEINVEFSLDGNLKHQLSVVLDSIVTHASRPLRAFVLCRDHDADDYHRLAQQFPTVSFEWLPTDAVDYGAIAGMLSYITVATMDRLLLADLLPDVARIIHFDLDALCLTDLAELYDTDLAGSPVAARTAPQPRFVSAFNGFRIQAARLHEPALAHELIVRTHARHTFDFRILNAGIMVLDLERMRADAFSRDFLPYAERFGFNDQEVLNVYVGADYAHLDGAWNRLVRLEAEAHVKIAHWAGPVKPWGPDYVAGRELWQDAEDRLAARLGAEASHE